MLFEKPSLRTRTTFEIARARTRRRRRRAAAGRRARAARAGLGRRAQSRALGGRASSSGRSRSCCSRSSPPPTARLHVINALTDDEHPCQALADCLTLRERWGTLAGRTLAFVGDGNNVAASLAHALAMLGVHLHVASPDGLPAPARRRAAGHERRAHGARLRLFTEAADAVSGADAVYTDTWTSMGQESEAESRRQAFSAYQVNEALMSLAKPGALFMHCLPAHRGRGSDRRGVRVGGLGRLRPGREPAALPEGAAVDAARAGRRPRLIRRADGCSDRAPLRRVEKPALRRWTYVFGVGLDLPSPGEPTVHRPGSPIAVRVLIADAAGTACGPVLGLSDVTRLRKSLRSEHPSARRRRSYSRIVDGVSSTT